MATSFLTRLPLSSSPVEVRDPQDMILLFRSSSWDWSFNTLELLIQGGRIPPPPFLNCRGPNISHAVTGPSLLSAVAEMALASPTIESSPTASGSVGCGTILLGVEVCLVLLGFVSVTEVANEREGME